MAFLMRAQREALDLLDRAGMEAIELPRSILRARSFGPAQTQKARNRAGGAARTAKPYQEIAQELRAVREKLQETALASAHVTGAVPERTLAADEEPDEARAEREREAFRARAKRAFSKIDRRGFEEASIDDPDLRDAHERGRALLLSLIEHIDRFLERGLSRVRGQDPEKPPLVGAFEEDRTIFEDHFERKDDER